MQDDRKIIGFERRSLGKKAGLKIGDTLVSINGENVADIFDYRFLCLDEKLCVDVLGEDNAKRTVNIEKEEHQDLGLVFSNPLLVKDKCCANKCIFCFIDQMPKGMRDTLYFKDDDMVLSFLTGSYVTLTNCPMAEIERIAKYHMSPINVSIHTMNPELRKNMLCHKGAGDVEEKMRRLLDAGITVNGQIVLCPGVNDGENLRYTLDKLLAMPENFGSCSIIPVGLTKFRDDLPSLRTFTKEEAENVIKLVEDYQKMARITRGTNLFYASDEFYLKAEKELPSYDDHDDFPQLENGVGMIRLLRTEVEDYLKEAANDKKIVKKLHKTKEINVTIATGELAAPEIGDVCKLIADFCSSYGTTLNYKVFAIQNEFFGPEITVAGLLTGKDIIKQLSDKKLIGKLLLTTNMFKSDEDVFLDDIKLEDLEKTLKIKAERVGKRGEELVKSVMLYDKH